MNNQYEIELKRLHEVELAKIRRDTVRSCIKGGVWAVLIIACAVAHFF